MLRSLFPPALPAACVGVLLCAGAARAQDAAATATIFEAALPGGLKAALAAADDRTTPDRSLFLYEFIRRTYDAPSSERDAPPSALLATMTAHLDRAATADNGASTADTVPLPLDPRVWTDVVFGGRANPRTIVRSILASRSAALLYCGLLHLDDETRAWMGSQPALLTEIVERYAAAFVIAAPGLRVSGGSVTAPGGGPAAPVWTALTGRKPANGAEFVRALLSGREGRVAYMFGAAAHLTPAELSYAFRLQAPREADRVDAGRQLLAVFEHISGGWNQSLRPFWRPALDPFLLLSDLPKAPSGLPVVPGTRTFWRAVLDDDGRGADAGTVEQAANEPVDFVWLSQQVFRGSLVVRRLPYRTVLFGSRILSGFARANGRDAVEAVRAAGRLPALVMTLERAHVTDPAVVAAAARRAAELSRIDDDPRAVRAIAQYQGVVFLITRAGARGAVPQAALPALVSAVTAVEPEPGGDYEGRLARWLDAFLAEHAKDAGSTARRHSSPFDESAGRADSRVLGLLAGVSDAEPRTVEWEGTRYAIDFSAAEVLRMSRLLGDSPKPYVASAIAIAEVAEIIARPNPDRDAVDGAADRLRTIATALAGGGKQESASVDGRSRDAANSVEREAARIAGRNPRLAATAARLRELSDDLLAFGLMQLVYAASLGQPERVAVSAGEAAGRHDFLIEALGLARLGPWTTPDAGTERARDWHVSGSLLGLDLRLAENSLVRRSLQLPPRRPTVAGEDRRTFVETAVLLDPRALEDADRDAIVAALGRGRARTAGLRTPAAAAAVAREIGLSPLRANLLSWTVAHDPARVPAFLDAGELLRVGGPDAPVQAKLGAWGVSGEARTGCWCLQFPEGRDLFAGRWTSGILATGFPDLNLRLADLLAQLRMPAVLLVPVLAAATLDFINGAAMRDPDDRRGLSAFVDGVDLEQVEQYLALLTTDGPLVPAADSRLGSGGQLSKTEGGR